MINTNSLRNTKLVNSQTQGRTAVLARADAHSQWVQVEAILGYCEALAFATELEDDQDQRRRLVSLLADEDWGQDAASV